MTPMPVLWHQRVAARLSVIVGLWCKENSGWEFFAPGGVFISQTSWLEPDLSVYAVPPGKTTSDWRKLKPPALVVEILSPSTTTTDRHRKRPAYLTHGVAEVWLVDIDARTFERWTAQSEFPQLHKTMIAWTPSDETPELAIEFDTLFAPPV